MSEKKIPGFFQRKYLINKEFQVPFIVRMLAISLMIIGMIYLSNLYVFFKFNDLGQSMGYSSDHEFYSFLKNQISLLQNVFLVNALALLVIVPLYGLFLSHRIAGPLENLRLKFEKTKNLDSLDEIKSISEAKFREKDFFKGLATEYNEQLRFIKKGVKQKKNLDNVTEVDFGHKNFKKSA